jgi:hypothetical protein
MVQAALVQNETLTAQEGNDKEGAAGCEIRRSTLAIQFSDWTFSKIESIG